jgi:hypothetical protein
MCNTKPNCQTKAKAEQQQIEVTDLRLRLDHYLRKQIAINQVALNYKAGQHTAPEAIEEIINLIQHFN